MKKTMYVAMITLIAVLLTLTTAHAATIATIGLTANGAGIIGMDPDTSVTEYKKLYSDEGRVPNWKEVFTSTGLVKASAASDITVELNVKYVQVREIVSLDGTLNEYKTLQEKADAIANRITREFTTRKGLEMVTVNVESFNKDIHVAVTQIVLVDGTVVTEFIRPDGQYTLCKSGTSNNQTKAKSTAKPTSEPVVVPTTKPTEKPVETPKPTEKPVETPKPTELPVATPRIPDATPAPQLPVAEPRIPDATPAPQLPVAEARIPDVAPAPALPVAGPTIGGGSSTTEDVPTDWDI